MQKRTTKYVRKGKCQTFVLISEKDRTAMVYNGERPKYDQNKLKNNQAVRKKHPADAPEHRLMLIGGEVGVLIFAVVVKGSTAR